MCATTLIDMPQRMAKQKERALQFHYFKVSESDQTHTKSHLKRTLQSQGQDGGDFKRARSTTLEDGGPKTTAAKAIEDKPEDGGTKAASEKELTEDEKIEKRKEEAEKKKEEIRKAQEAEEKKRQPTF